MKKTLLALLLTIPFTFTQAQDIELQIGNVTPSGANYDIEILMSSKVDIVGLELYIAGGVLRDAYGGAAEKHGWFAMVDSAQGQVASGSMSVQTMPAVDTTLLHIVVGMTQSPENVCIIQHKLGNSGGVAHSVIVGDSCVTITGVDDLAMERKHFEVYPNPSNDGIFTINETNLKSIEVYDLLGNKLLQEMNVLRTIDLSAYSKGVYFLRVNTDKASYTQRLLYN